MSAAEEFEEERSWKSCVVNGEEKRIDMKVIEPYRKVLSHGGIVFKHIFFPLQYCDFYFCKLAFMKLFLVDILYCFSSFPY